ncbi:MAG TPA: glycosyltransferase family 61 protein [Chloroflexota bacterium]|nr:glycosyltransferase family 61 protein [Chloroflexota bacterium]
MLPTATWSTLRLNAIYQAVLARNRFRRLEWDLVTPRDMSARVRARCATWQESSDGRGYADEGQRVSYLCSYRGDCLIEPRYGYVIERPLRLIDLSMPFSEWSRDKTFRHLIGFPSVTSILLALAGRRPVLRHECVLSLRFYWEDNYFHFLNDILPRVRMANVGGVPNDVPVVVGRKLAGQKFFQSAFPDGTIDGRQIIFQGEAFVASKQVVFARPPTDDQDSPAYVADLLGAPKQPRGDNRVFVTRSRARGRYILNLDALRPVFARFDVNVVEAETLTMADQVKLFSSAALIVGIHGAGLGNMIFRRNAACTILEILPPGETATWFPRLARRLEFAYRSLPGYVEGAMIDRHQPFMVRPEDLAEVLRSVIAPA